MKILYICGDTGIEIGGRKGAATHVREACHALMRFGHQVLLITPCAGDRSQIRFPLIEVPPPETKWIGADLRHILLNRRIKRALARAIREFQPDAVYERYSLYQTAGLQLCAQQRIPRILEVNTLLAREQRARLHWPRYAEIVESALWRKEAAIICVSRKLKELMIQSAKLDERTMAGFVISPVAVDPEIFNPSVQPADVSALVTPGFRVAGYMGTLTSWHGVDLFFDAARALREKDVSVRILAFGGEQERVAKLNQRATEQSVESHLYFAGSIPHTDVPRYLAAMDICLIADTQDWSSPTKFFEFAAMERPVVAARSPAVEEVFGHGQPTGLFFERGNGLDMAEKIIQVLNDQELAHNLGRAARRRVLRRYTWECNVAVMMQLYKKLGVQAAEPPPNPYANEPAPQPGDFDPDSGPFSTAMMPA